jgi:hypothetical protein
VSTCCSHLARGLRFQQPTKTLLAHIAFHASMYCRMPACVTTSDV